MKKKCGKKTKSCYGVFSLANKNHQVKLNKIYVLHVHVYDHDTLYLNRANANINSMICFDELLIHVWSKLWELGVKCWNGDQVLTLDNVRATLSFENLEIISKKICPKNNGKQDNMAGVSCLEFLWKYLL